MELGRIADARETFENLVRTNENYTQAYYYLGESSGRLGDMFAAHYNLGRFYQQKGDLENAGFHLNRALKLATNESQKQMVKTQLKALASKKEKKHSTG
jgi:tetratricopeptide (TPR) repeat protein